MKQTKPFRLWSRTPPWGATLLNGYDTLQDAKDAGEHCVRFDRDNGKECSYYVFKGKVCLWYSGNHPNTLGGK